MTVVGIALDLSATENLVEEEAEEEELLLTAESSFPTFPLR